MSLMVAIPLALAAAVAYGGSTAVEHSAVHRPAADPEATATTRLLALLRSPRWLLGMAGDGVGLLLQIMALATGPVVLVQPILILALPVSLPIAWALGGPRPRASDYRHSAVIVLALGAFFALIGDPGPPDRVGATPVLVAAAAVVGLGLGLLAAAQTRLRRCPGPRAAVIGGVAGAWFGLVAVLMDCVASAWSDGGLAAIGQARGWVPLAILAVVGAASIALTQVAFQIGALEASFPANAVADPVTAIALGALLLHEDVPVGAGRIAAYAVCLVVIVHSMARLARPRPGALPLPPTSRVISG